VILVVCLVKEEILDSLEFILGNLHEAKKGVGKYPHFVVFFNIKRGKPF